MRQASIVFCGTAVSTTPAVAGQPRIAVLGSADELDRLVLDFFENPTLGKPGSSGGPRIIFYDLGPRT